MQDVTSPVITSGSGRSFTSIDSAALDMHRVVALLAVGALGFVLWLVVLISIAPHKLLTYLAFLTPFWIFLSAFTAVGLYWWRSRHGSELAAIRSSMRHAAILASIIVAILALSAGHWLSLTSVVIVLAGALAVEGVSWLRASPGVVEGVESQL